MIIVYKTLTANFLAKLLFVLKLLSGEINPFQWCSSSHPTFHQQGQSVCMRHHQGQCICVRYLLRYYIYAKNAFIITQSRTLPDVLTWMPLQSGSSATTHRLVCSS